MPPTRRPRRRPSQVVLQVDPTHQSDIEVAQKVEIAKSLGGIEKSLELVLKTQSEDRQSSAAWRTTVHDKFDKMSDKQDETQGDLKSVSKTVTEDLKPKVDALWQDRQQSQGVKQHSAAWGRVLTPILGFLGALAAVVLGHFWPSVAPK